MRPLNRPMFKMGGPIKEGIMDSMKSSPQQLVRSNADGSRPGYAGPLAALPLIFQGLRVGSMLRPVAQGAGIFSRINPMRLLTSGRFRDTTKQIIDPAKIGQGVTKATPGGGVVTTTAMKTVPERLGFFKALSDPKRLGMAIRENPFTAASLLAPAGIATELVGKGTVGAAKMTPDVLRAYANAVIPFADPFTKKEEDIKTTDDGTGIKRGGKNVGDTSITGTTKPGTKGGSTVKSDAEKQQINEARIQETKNKYYKLMGIDKMNKDAAYDSLIDASKIVQEEGADLKGAIRSGNLQNRIIQAISQNLDKSADLKKQIDAAVLKGEIEKDINKTKLTSFQEQIKFIKENPNDPLAKKLSGATSVADNLAALTGKTITSDDVQRLVESKGQEVKGQVKDDKYQKWEKNNEGRDEIDYLQDVFKGKTLDAGIYIINKKAIRIDEGGNAFPVDLDSIIG